MKAARLLCLFLAFCISASTAAVIVTPTGISVEAVLEGTAQHPTIRLSETLDYLTFELTTAGSVRLIGTDLSSTVFLALGQVVGPSEQIHDIGDPYRILYRRGDDPFNPPPPPEFTRVLDPGIYVVQIATEEYRDGDLGFGFVPVDRQRGGFTRAPYSFAVEGPIQGLEFREGNLDGTFTVTQVPEPSAAALLGLLAAATLRRRRAH